MPNGADFSIAQILNEFHPANAKPLYQRYSDSFGGGQTIVNLDRVFHFADPPEADAAGGTSPAVPSDIPAAVLETIRGKCAEDWPDDYRMRAFCEKQQFEGDRAVR